MIKPSFLSAFTLILFGSLSQAVDYESEIHPILKQRCGKCHMDGETRGDLSLDKDQIHKQIGDGCIIPGDVKNSDLHWTMTLDVEEYDEAMPPKGPRVPDDEIALIARWIEAGAKLPTLSKQTKQEAPVRKKPAPVASKPAGPRKPYTGTFENIQGKRLVDIKLLRVEGDRVVFLLPDSHEYRCPTNLLAPASQKIVEKFIDGALQ